MKRISKILIAIAVICIVWIFANASCEKESCIKIYKKVDSEDHGEFTKQYSNEPPIESDIILDYDIGTENNTFLFNRIYYNKTKQRPIIEDGYVRFEDLE